MIYQLSKAEIAAVVHYERHSWGNNAGDVTQPVDVANAASGLGMQVLGFDPQIRVASALELSNVVRITDALADRSQHHSWGYISSTESLRDAIVQWNGERQGLDMDPESIVVSHGVSLGMKFNASKSRMIVTTSTEICVSARSGADR